MASTLSTFEATTLAPARRGVKGGGKKRPGPYPYWFYVAPALIYAIFFIVPTIASFYYSFTRWDLFTATWIGLDNYQTFFEEQALILGLRNTLIYAVITSGLKVVIGMALALLLTSKIIARGYLRSVIFFPVLVSAVGVGLTFTVLMNPERGLINQLLGGADIGWLTNPNLAIFSIALVDVWKGVGLATVIFIAGLVSIPTEYYEAAAGRRSQPLGRLPEHHPPPRSAGHCHGDHAVPHRRAALVRPDLGDDQGRTGFRLRRDRVGDLQAVPGRLLRPVHGGQRRAVPGRHGDRRPADQVAQSRR